MNNGIYVASELAVSVGVSTATATSINAEPLITALISLGVSLVSIVGGELIKFLVAYIQKKRKELNDEEKDGSKNG